MLYSAGRMDTKIKRRSASSFRLHYALRIQLYEEETVTLRIR